ncbi:ABC transporter ATP-binding protein [Meiothermus ruber]|jgi:ATP-binding cassette subfamily B protein|uniref:ABC transporter n=1 Tax=Meiothermus ruber (strain ATCC 35948 / DSM 1279 / VKM B-1258 / 21) TaxID=504728 RepID=D3PPU0_MEIRD|nr:ABC transporter ATP-binding protein [Meiothermus ruber]ADD27566.1 ABC transporter related protein [Meiothermus ruber DSM 1279]AGK04031.1 ABC transporter [Meiothermus ruber DSM 1279]MCL6529884.1 ABC transporter ATP-binding protein/permease [Meiothermus ruber]MCX7802470.1 ABC transporter ATP-binding protein/permease [Meiothermus ruber]
MHEEEAFKKSFDAKLARRILKYVRPYWKQVGLALLALVVSTLTAASTPLFLKYAIDNAIVPREALPLAQRYETLLLVCAVFLAVRVVDFIANYAQTYLISWVGQHILFDLRSEIFAKLQRMHLGYFDRNPVGRLMTRITSDVDAINQFITGGLVGLIADFALIIGLMVFMLVLDWRLALVAFAIMPIFLAVTTWIRGGMREAYRAMRLRLSKVNASLQENLAGVQTTQLFNREPKNEAQFNLLSSDLRRAWVEIIKWFALFFPLVGLMGEFTVALVLWYGGGQVIQQAITLGLLVAFTDYVRQLFQPLQDLSEKFNIFQAAMASAERIFGLLDTKEEVADKPGALPVERFRGQIDFEDVWFAYGRRGERKPQASESAEQGAADTPPSASSLEVLEPTTPEEGEWDWVLRGVSFRVRPGEKVALVGATGAGKTSVISLIARFYDVQQGAVKIDGLDVRDYRQRDLRRAIGIVLQDPFLFSGTIESNLRLGDERITPERIQEVCAFVGADEFIQRLPQGYQTVLHERGGGLSTGQKQLLALARAILHNPDILLILDEATANVDSETEQKIQAVLERVMQGRTSIVIAHRLSTIRHVDRILVFRKGKLLEEGSHDELLRQGGYYAKLYELQYVHGGAD